MKAASKKRYSAEFKAQAVGLVSLGSPVAKVAEELGVGLSLLYGWVQKEARATQLGSEGQRAAGEEPAADELRRLRAENTHLKLENDILKKAAVILGTKTLPEAAR